MVQSLMSIQLHLVTITMAFGSYVAGTVMLSNMVFKSSSEAWSPKSLFINGRKGYF